MFRLFAKGAVRTGLLVAAAALLLTACGRKGDLERPPSANVEDQPKTLTAGTAPKHVPDKPFILDGLL